MSREHDFEPVRGLPGDLPAGERIVWQGSPRWTRLACDAFHIRAVALYFGVMLAWRAAAAIGAGVEPGKAVATALSAAPLALAGVALLGFLAWLNARTTVYTVTSRRVVLRFGVALTKAINLPFSIVESGAVKAHADGSGDLALTLKAPNKLGFLHLWPHVRPWKVAAPQPAFRAIPDAASVGVLLAQAMKAELPVEITSAAPAEPRARRGPARPQTATA